MTTPSPRVNFTISDKEFEVIRYLVKQKTGLSLGLHERYLVISRLSRCLRTLGLASFSEYVEVPRQVGDGGELVQMINRITTNKTDFYREKHHFDMLAGTVLPKIVAAGESSGQRVLRAWSSVGCSFARSSTPSP